MRNTKEYKYLVIRYWFEASYDTKSSFVFVKHISRFELNEHHPNLEFHANEHTPTLGKSVIIDHSTMITIELPLEF